MNPRSDCGAGFQPLTVADAFGPPPADPPIAVLVPTPLAGSRASLPPARSRQIEPTQRSPHDPSPTRNRTTKEVPMNRTRPSLTEKTAAIAYARAINTHEIELLAPISPRRPPHHRSTPLDPRCRWPPLHRDARELLPGCPARKSATTMELATLPQSPYVPPPRPCVVEYQWGRPVCTVLFHVEPARSARSRNGSSPRRPSASSPASTPASKSSRRGGELMNPPQPPFAIVVRASRPHEALPPWRSSTKAAGSPAPVGWSGPSFRAAQTSTYSPRTSTASTASGCRGGLPACPPRSEWR